MNRSRLLFAAALLAASILCRAGEAAAVAAPGATAGPAGSTALDRYYAQALDVRFSLWTGLKLYRGEQLLRLGYFGSGYESVFAGSADALDAMGTFRTMRIAGMALYSIGLGALVLELVLLLTNKTLLMEQSSIKTLFWALLIPGAVVGMTGAFLIQGANAKLSDAVRAFNRDLYRRLRGDTAAVGGRSVMVTWRKRF